VVSEAKSDRTSAGFSSFYKTRRRIYGVLLLFVVAVGVPTAAVPKLRGRLVSRAQAIWNAAIGKREPVMVQVGENQEPLPAEFEWPAPPVVQMPQLPATTKVLTTPQGGYLLRRDGARPSSKAGDTERLSAQGEEALEDTEAEPAAADNEPKYQQGKVEQEVYNLLLNSNPAIAEIAKGKNPSFKFKSWDAAGRGEDTYWVRLKLETEGKPVADYIWQVKLGSKQVSPLNYNARTIS
jgi:hypothetical protein